MKEVWRPIPGFPDYEVSTIGRVKRVADSKTRGKKGDFLKPQLRHGRWYYTLHTGKSFRHRNAPRAQLILEAFICRKPGPNYITHHLDGNKENDTLENLSWISKANHNRLHHRKLLQNSSE